MWIMIDDTHYNINQITSFRWEDGYLILWTSDSDSSIVFPDTDRTIYGKLCNAIGISMAPEEKLCER